MTRVEWSYTYSHEKYKPMRASISFDVPEDVLVSDAFFLARVIVHLQLRIAVPEGDLEFANKLCQKVLNEPIRSFIRNVPNSE